MFTQIITPDRNPILIDIPDEFIGHRLTVTIEDSSRNDLEAYSYQNALKFFEAHRVDLSNFKFDRDEANER